MDFSKYLGEAGLSELWDLIMAQMDSRVFIGTREEYESEINNIPNGALVIITDDADVITPPPKEEIIEEFSAVLGSAILGKMQLGKE